MRGDWLSILVVGAGSLVAGVAWRGITRPMGDSASYRSAGLEILHGWHHVTDRTPGYPLLLWATGSLHHETHLLFLAQLALHAASVLLVVHLGRDLGLPPPWRAASAVLLMAPPEMVSIVYAGSEVLAQALLVLALWLFVRWSARPRGRTLVGLGIVLAALAWVTPAFQLVVVPVGLAVALVGAPTAAAGGRRARATLRCVALMAVPAVVLTGSLGVINAARFSSPGLSPLTGWYLSSRTSEYVERLPLRYEPARSVLIAERNRQRDHPATVDAPNYAFAVRGRLEQVTGRHGPALDRYMLDLNLYLIAHHPFDYQDAVGQAAARYAQVESEPAIIGLGTLAAWLLSVVHLVLVAAFVGQAILVPGLLLRSGAARRVRAALAFAALVALSSVAVATMTETGTSRLRAPIDPLLVLLLVTGWWVVRRAAPRRGRAAGPVHP